jgi:Zn-dependent protease
LIGTVLEMPLTDILLDRAIAFIPVLLSLTVHEWAHAWTAFKLGDDTAKMLGRMSLNPIDHIDPVGTLLLPLLGVPFGWAKPVPVNPVRFRTSISMPIGMMITAAAGPISNLLLATLGCLMLFGLTRFGTALHSMGLDTQISAALSQFLHLFVLINILLACFNLLPIPPLDGSRVADALMPDTMRPLWSQFTAMGPVFLAAVILLPALLGFSLLSWPRHWADALLTWVTTS